MAPPGLLSFVGGLPCRPDVSRAYAGGLSRGFLDVDGDGLPDFLDGVVEGTPPPCEPLPVPLGNGLQLYRNRGDGSFERVGADNGVWTALTAALVTYAPVIAALGVGLIDINGDALPDVVRSRDGNSSCPGFGATCSWDVALNLGGARSSATTMAVHVVEWPGVPADLGSLLPAPLGVMEYIWERPPAQLIDLTGDGLSDIVDCPSATSYLCSLYVNTGASFADPVPLTIPTMSDGDATKRTPLAAEIRTTGSRTQIKKLVDLNGDGLPDLASSRSSLGSGHWDVALNTGHGFIAAANWPTPPYDIEVEDSSNDAADDYGLRRALRDMNGDGLPDYVDATTTPRWTVYLNTGAGFAPGVDWAGAEGRPLVKEEFAWDTMDLNGDGIADVVEVAPSGGLQARYGVGPRGDLLAHQENGLGGSSDVVYLASSNRAAAGSGCVGGTNAGAPCFSNTECPGAGTCAEPCPDCSRLPFPTWVVDTLTARSGFTDPANGYVTEFTFTGGYFDPVGHQFRGFRQSLEHRLGDPQHDPQHERKIRRQFAPPPVPMTASPSWPASPPSRAFKLFNEQVLDNSGNRLSEMRVSWSADPTAVGRVQVHTGQRKEISYTVSGGATQKERIELFSSYDEFNNARTEVTYGKSVSGSTTTDDFPPIVTTATYASTAPCYGQPTRVIVTSNSLDLSERDFTYDTACNLRTISARLAASGQSASGGRLVTTTLDYDQSSQNPDAAAAKAGQPTKITDARGNATTLKYATGFPSCNTNGLYPCQITLPTTSYSTMRINKTYDLRWGKPLSITDANNAKTTFTYDGLGRLTAVTRPLDLPNNGSSTPHEWRTFTYSFGAAATATAPARATRIDTAIREPNDTSLGFRTVSSFVDGLGRPLGSKQQQYIDGLAYMVVHDAVSFDAVGRVAARYAPFVAPTNDLTTYDAPLDGSPKTSVTYDVLDRVISTTNPDGTSRSMDYGVAGQLSASDENYTSGAYPGARTVETRDALGRVTRQQQYTRPPQSSSDTLITTSDTTYDGLGRVTTSTTTDAATNKFATTRFEYDSLGRRTKLTDPDSGDWVYDYDDAGNLVYQDDPRMGQHLEFCYDQLNRVTLKVAPPGDTPLPSAAYQAWCGTSTSTPTPTPTPTPAAFKALVRYSYDMWANGAGRLSEVSTLEEDGSTARTTYSYDARGRVTAEDLFRSVVIAGQWRSGGASFGYTYDAADRLAIVTYPTNAGTEGLSYSYNDLGQLVSVYTPGQTYAFNMRYDLLGRRTQWTLGSGLVEHASYDSTGSDRFRLQQLRTAPDATSNDSLQRFDYANRYDRTGNLLQLTDSTSYAPGMSLANSWAYQYDGLGRLRSAQRGTAAATAMTYDGLGNMKTLGGLSFAYAGTAPHHISSSTPASATPAYGYEPDGGLMSRPDVDGNGADAAHTLEYDADGRVKTVTVNGHTVRSVYDAQGERVARIVDENTPAQTVTFYYGRWAEVMGNTLTRHIYLGNRLLAESPIDAGALNLAASDDPHERIMLARTLSEAAANPERLRPVVALSGSVAIMVAGGAVFLCVGLMWLPGRVRVAVVGRVRRGPVTVLVVLCIATLLPLPRLQPAWAGNCTTCGGSPPPPPPVFPVYFVHTDHLGSTTMLTCYKQTGCADRAVVRYYRYDAYGQVTAYAGDGSAVPVTTALTSAGPSGGTATFVPERLYTGQHWDDAAQLYYYGARFYDPRIASFVSEDPAREYMNPYAYVGWNPVRYVDPTGAYLDTSVAVGGTTTLAVLIAILAPEFAGNAVGGAFAAASAGTASDATPGSVGLAFLVGFSTGPVGGALAKVAGITGAKGLVLGKAISGGIGAAVGTAYTQGENATVGGVLGRAALGGLMAGVGASAGVELFGSSPTAAGIGGSATSFLFSAQMNAASTRELAISGLGLGGFGAGVSSLGSFAGFGVGPNGPGGGFGGGAAGAGGAPAPAAGAGSGGMNTDGASVSFDGPTMYVDYPSGRTMIIYTQNLSPGLVGLGTGFGLP